MPLSRLIFILVTVLALAGGTIAFANVFLGAGGMTSLPQIILFSTSVVALALGLRLIARRHDNGRND